MKFIKFTIIYLLLLVSYLSYRFAQLEPDNLHAIAAAFGSVGSLLAGILALIKDYNIDVQDDDHYE